EATAPERAVTEATIPASHRHTDAGSNPSEGASGSSPKLGKLLDQLLRRVGCSSRILLGEPLHVALRGDTHLAGAPAQPPGGANTVRLVRAEAPGGRRFFEDTPIVPFSVWYPLQQQRIRYFKKRDTDASTSGNE